MGKHSVQKATGWQDRNGTYFEHKIDALRSQAFIILTEDIGLGPEEAANILNKVHEVRDAIAKYSIELPREATGEDAGKRILKEMQDG